MRPRSSEQSISANKNYFDSRGITQKHDEQHLHNEMAKRIGKALLNIYSFDDEHTTMLDFACGTGLNSRFLAPYVKSIIGVDISQEMVDRYNKRVENQGISQEEMRAICVPEELLDTSIDQESDNRLKKLLGDVEFDVAICCMSYHHFPSISSATRLLSSLLRPGGYLYVADVESISKADHTGQSITDLEPIFPDGACDAGVVMHQYGFSEVQIKDSFVNAGLAGLDAETGQISRFTYDVATRAFKNGKAVNIFIAGGMKPPL
ncbi:hexaprenyldihydroxybenzoate methyltransferase [Lentinula aciculospora]|uniref:Hexaprenyldihydroxybenzoate methyltransferase n=1 Tax=Lentinula aciculospora TaxID=153920 RepID=A0A9W9DHK6_9AGAR|nr:hexaprenyldihydroxybenzoate methyltransferase [Lentinula aciculospora]